MSKFELSISEDYVRDWGITEAVRELFQNALDQETIDPVNRMSIDVQDDNKTYRTSANEAITVGLKRMCISNRTSSLTAKSLLLGESTKRDDNSTIGKFGEGYKLALLVLCRIGKQVTIYNYGAKEIWRPRLSRSRKYGDASILVIDTEKKHFWDNVPNNDLTFEISNITSAEFDQVLKTNLHLYNKYVSEASYISNCCGTIITEDTFKGDVFVNGLFITHDDALMYGYNFRPSYITLDRDRRTVSGFNLYWGTSLMWQNSSHSPLLVTLAQNDKVKDLAYYADMNRYYNQTDAKTLEESYVAFRRQYGDNAIPVTDNDDIQKFKSTYKYSNTAVDFVIVPAARKCLISSSSSYQSNILAAYQKRPPKSEPSDYLEDLCIAIYDNGSGNMDTFDKAWWVLRESYNWTDK